MENTPLVPRQRNRRTDRLADAAPQPVQHQAVQGQPMAPAQPVAPAQPMAPAQPVVYQKQRLPQRPMQASYGRQDAPQTPRTMYQQTPAQRYASPAPQQPAQAACSPRPKALHQRTAANSGWQQPTVPAQTEAPRARATQGFSRDLAREERAARQEAAAPKEKPARRKLPKWLTWSTTLCFFLVLSLFTAYWLMQAYLVTEENKRIAAYEATLQNYHITERADGSLAVTWQDQIEQYAAQYNLQPAFVMAIIRNESSFRTNAESSVGARGLMQLMPDTAEWIAGKLDDHSFTADDLWDADTNIRYGCWYLNYLTRLFHGDAELVSAAYHAGQTTVTQWLSDRTKSSDGISLDLEKLPDGPTKQYIGRVTQTYGIYQTLLYPDEAFGAVPAGSDDPAAQLR